MDLPGSPLSWIIAGLLVPAATWLAVGSGRLIARGLRLARPLDLIRGIRQCVLALVVVVLVGTLLSGHMGFLVLGAIILAEELHEDRYRRRHHPARRARLLTGAVGCGAGRVP